MGKRFNFRCIYTSPAIFFVFVFLANTTGTSKYSATLQAIPIPDASIVRILLIALTLKTAFKLLADLLEQMNIHLVIQETIHFQYISCSYDSIFTDSVV